MIGFILKKFGYVKPSTNRHQFTEEERARAEITKATNARIRNIEKLITQQNRLSEIEGVLNPKATPQEMLMSVVAQKLMQPTQPQPTQPTQTTLDNTKYQEFTDEEIKTFLDQNSQYVAYAKNISDEEIKNHIKQKSPTISKNSVERAIQLIRSEY